jgi:hypothetical protein
MGWGWACGTYGREEEKINACRGLVGKCEGRRQLGDLGVDGRVILKLVLKK